QWPPGLPWELGYAERYRPKGDLEGFGYHPGRLRRPIVRGNPNSQCAREGVYTAWCKSTPGSAMTP
ncbi:hypothetical protein U6N61_12175, partial [Cutibacterium acnes]